MVDFIFILMSGRKLVTGNPIINSLGGKVRD